MARPLDRAEFIEHAWRSKPLIYATWVTIIGLSVQAIWAIAENLQAFIPDWPPVVWLVLRNLSFVLCLAKFRVYLANFRARRQSAAQRLKDGRDLAILGFLVLTFGYPWPYGTTLGAILGVWCYIWETYQVRLMRASTEHPEEEIGTNGDVEVHPLVPNSSLFNILTPLSGVTYPFNAIIRHSLESGFESY